MKPQLAHIFPPERSARGVPATPQAPGPSEADKGPSVLQP
jgi:hypothetical protein